MTVISANKASGKIRSFTGLVAWREAHTLFLEVHGMSKKFPKEELFGLVSQMRRSAMSISSNIAEGFSRRTRKEKVQFYYIALGSVTELQNQLLASRDIGYVSNESFQRLAERSVLVHKLINGLIKNATSA